MAEWLRISRAVVAALYLQGSSQRAHGLRYRWPRVVAALVASACNSQRAVPELLASAGLLPESLALGTPGALGPSLRLVDEGSALTVFDHEYPSSWFESLGASAPPALYRRGSNLRGGRAHDDQVGRVALAVCGSSYGEAPCEPSYFGVGGSRRPSHGAMRFAKQLSSSARDHGLVVVSGGAEGFDDLCLSDGGTAILPRGFSTCNQRYEEEWSVCAPGEPFSAGTAMERNRLIYAVGEASLVAEPRLRTGGSWHGAAECLRLRLSRLHVLGGSSEATDKLVALGAVPVGSVGAIRWRGDRPKHGRLIREPTGSYAA